MHWLAKHLSRFGAVGAVFASLCCLGFSALLSVLAAIGLGFLINDAILLPMLVVFLGVYVAGLVLGFRQHRKWPVLALGVLAAVANFGFIFIVFVRPIAYVGVALLVAVSIWDLIERKKALATKRDRPLTP